MKKTPGPWGTQRGVDNVIYGPDGYQICRVAKTNRVEGNVNLISSAPELLNVLEEILSTLALERNPILYRKACDIVDKATGWTPKLDRDTEARR